MAFYSFSEKRVNSYPSIITPNGPGNAGAAREFTKVERRPMAYGVAFAAAGLAAGAAAFGFQNESSLIHSSET